MNGEDAPSAPAGDGLAAFCFNKSAAEPDALGDAEALGVAVGRGVAVARGVAVGLPEAFGVPDGDADAVAGVIGGIEGAIDACGGFVS